MRHTLVLILAAGFAGACAARPDIEPAPGAQPAPPGPGEGAQATVNGVTVVARGDAWRGFPEQLEEVTPG